MSIAAAMAAPVVIKYLNDAGLVIVSLLTEGFDLLLSPSLSLFILLES